MIGQFDVLISCPLNFNIKIMKSLINILVATCFFLLTIPGFAQSGGDSIFWKATRFNNVIYILGVTHVGFKSQYPIPDKIMNAFNISGVYITETHAIYADEDEINSIVNKYFLVAPNNSLGDLIKYNKKCGDLARSENLVGNIEDIYGMELSSKILKLSPSYLIFLSWSRDLMPKNHTSYESVALSRSIESYLHTISINKNMHRRFLDPEYWEAIEDFSPYERCELIAGLMAERKEIDPYIDANKAMLYMQKLWSKGNATEIERIYFSPLASRIDRFEEIKRKNFALRNRHMVEKILLFSGEATQPTFVAVGAAHLRGEQGIVQILKNSGFTVSPQ